MAVVVITGASSGLGEAAARELAARGHKLVLAARRVDRLESLRQELSARTEVLVVPTDVADPGAMERLAEAAVAGFGRIDVWVNNAGVGREPWWEHSPAESRQVIDVNLTAPILGARAALPRMLKQGSGHIINVASVAGHVAVTGVYSATKAGLRAFSEAMRREMAGTGIKVSVVSPGYIRTEMTADVPLRMPGAELVGRAIANLIERPRKEIVVPGWYWGLIWLCRCFPWLVDMGVARMRKGGPPRAS